MISVIIPVYQARPYLEKCVNSVINQSYVNLEILLLDDGSTDGSAEICDQLAKQDCRIKVIHKKNTGVADTRNLGISLAKGDYISFVDSDDYIDICMYQNMMEIAEEYGCDVVMCDCLKEFDDHSTEYTHNIRSGYYTRKDLKSEYFNHLLIMENLEYPATISNWLLLFRKKLSTGKELPSYLSGVRYSEDLLFGAELLYAAGSFYYMKEHYYYHYVMNPLSATHKFVPDKWKDYLMLYERAKFVFEKENDFKKQLDMLLLFFVYNSVGDILWSDGNEVRFKITEAKRILCSPEVREAFKRIKISKLPVSWKLKIQTYMYKYKLGLRLLCRN